MKPLLIPDYLESNQLISLIVVALQCLTERPFAQEVLDFVAVGQMILKYDLIVPPFIIIPTIMLLIRTSPNLLCIQPQEVYLPMLKYLRPLEFSEPIRE